MRILVMHGTYGCDTGCCGHFFIVEGMKGQGHIGRSFMFTHPYGEDHLEWAKELVRKEFGEEHIADLDWGDSIVLDD